MTLDRRAVKADFAAAINMDAGDLEDWLESPQSLSVGQKKNGATESVGHAAGRGIVAILRTPDAALDDQDYRLMRKAVGFIRRHRAQEPANMVTSRWRYSLMNWGHDPLR
ncbi:DUF3140 domain-containing protein [Allosphingosinicella deserti]|uniref:DNA-binding protein n=1 Tax=Allosphingosinicella deserti TaxID=2116704 RepID=A0A2P7QHX7_9SPHN|nr:DUF3140 domain-containing protein [Sphingomonas deserti]PSJ37540.1 DNA-binding protein [Sphingomonas deserti]